MSIKKLASQTVWYGLSSIAARFINVLLTPLLTYNLANMQDYGKIGLIYSAIPILNILFTYGFETAYFRFAGKEENKNSIYSTAALSLLFSTIIFTALLWIFQNAFGAAIGLTDFPGIIRISIFIIAIDALATIPFARLRQQGRPIKYAVIKIAGILINVFFTWFFIVYCPKQLQANEDSWVSMVYNEKTNPVVYVLVATLLQAIFTLLLLAKEIAAIQFSFNKKLWKQMMVYSMPLIIVGMGGMVNETFDRLMLRWWLPGDVSFREEQVGIYNACYKLSLLITLFVQAFRMGAEPFFFKQAEGDNPQKMYARVMKFFVITISVVFLLITLFIPVWKYFIGEKYREGLAVVPILTLANMCLGIYYNLSIWYKLANRTMAGATITLIGAAITCAVNWFFIPRYGYMASAWATFLCYFSMMALSYVWGQKVYPVPYAWKKLLAYMVIALLLYFVYQFAENFIAGITASLTLSCLLTLAFIVFVIKVEKKEFVQLPIVGGVIRRFL